MNEDLRAIAEQALADLREVSPQVRGAIVLSRDGSTIAHTGEAADPNRLGAIAMDIVEAADGARRDLGREPVTQCEIATGTGHVFVVADARNVVLAVTPTDPTVGLVFYDLKTTLRTLRESGATAGAPSANGSSAKGKRKEAEA